MSSILDEEETARLNTLPSADSITLLFKFAKHTILLSALSTQPFDEIKDLLLLALRARAIDKIHEVSLPEDVDDLELGVLVDRKEINKGWIPVEEKEREEAAKATSGGRKKSAAPQNSPAAVGLGDGGWIAVRVKGTAKIDQELDSDGDAIININDPGWSVILPSLEDEDD